MSGEVYALVTGGDKGIGRAVVLRFAREGFNVRFTYRRNREGAEEVCREASKYGVDCRYCMMDVSSVSSVDEAYKFFSENTPHLNILVNNAGVLSLSPLREMGIEEWVSTINVNLTGAFIVTKKFLPLLEKAPWASIVNVSSIAGQTGNVFASIAYCASKAGLIGFTRRLAVELAPKIRVNAVAPSFVETDMTRMFLDDPEKRRRIAELHPLKDIAKPEDVAEAVFFLATPASRFITGQVIGVNGGRLTC